LVVAAAAVAAIKVR